MLVVRVTVLCAAVLLCGEVRGESGECGRGVVVERGVEVVRVLDVGVECGEEGGRVGGADSSGQ